MPEWMIWGGLPETPLPTVAEIEEAKQETK